MVRWQPLLLFVLIRAVCGGSSSCRSNERQCGAAREPVRPTPTCVSPKSGRQCGAPYTLDLTGEGRAGASRADDNVTRVRVDIISVRLTAYPYWGLVKTVLTTGTLGWIAHSER